MIYITIDIGNTRSKIGLFTQEGLQTLYISETILLQEKLKEILSTFPSDKDIVIAYISTAKETEIENWDLGKEHAIKIIKIDASYPFPLHNHYATPLTLGTDRIVGIIAASKQAQTKYVLVIDTGTAITYDFADTNGNYWGGAISLGLRMRFRALHEFTARLPLISDIKHVPLVGNSTQNSLLSGVVNGTIAEIRATIMEYQREYGADMSIFLTGGDASFLAEKMQGIPFILDETLILKGVFALISR